MRMKQHSKGIQQIHKTISNSSLNSKCKPILEKQIYDAISPIFVIEEDEKAPMHQPYPIMQLVQRRCKVLQNPFLKAFRNWQGKQTKITAQSMTKSTFESIISFK